MSCFGVFSIHNFQVLRRPNEEDTAELPFGKWERVRVPSKIYLSYTGQL